MNKLKKPGQRRDCAITIRLRPIEYSNLSRAADSDGRSMSDAARRLIEHSLNLKHRDQEPVAQQHAS